MKNGVELQPGRPFKPRHGEKISKGAILSLQEDFCNFLGVFLFMLRCAPTPKFKRKGDNAMVIRSNSNVKKWFMLVGLVFVMVAAGEVFGIKAASAAAKPRTLRMIQASEPVHLDRVLRAEQTGEPIWENVLEPLMSLGKAGEPIPMLATRWEHSADLTRWRFYLRKGVKFHNGVDFTACDVVETAKYLIDVKSVSFLYPRVPIKEAVTVDDYTVDLIFGKPQPLLPINIRFFLIYPATIARDNREIAKTVCIGTGPYRFVEWKKGLNIKLTKSEGYWGPKPQIDDVTITFRAEEGVRLAALLAGEVDWVYGLSPESVSRTNKVINMPSPETVWIRFDESVQKEFTGEDPIFADNRLRLAVDYAIDRRALIALYGGQVTPSLGQFASPGEFGFNPNLKSRPYDLEKARALVKEAGAVGRTVSLVSQAGRYAKDREAGEAIAYMIEQTGFKVKLMLLPPAEAQKYKSTQGADRRYMADLHVSASDAFMEVETRAQTMFVEGGVHYALNDLEPTRLYKEAQAETDYAKRWEKVGKVWAYVYEKAHYVPLYKLPWIWGIARNLEWQPDLARRPYVPAMRFTD